MELGCLIYDWVMALRQHHYERAFESYLRDQHVPYIAVNEAKRALLPADAKFQVDDGSGAASIKNFDFVVYGSGQGGGLERAENLIVEIKGRRLPRIRLADGTPAKPRLESWVTEDDVLALERWQSLFGVGYRSVFVFVYWCDDIPPDGLFTEVFEYQGRWYTVRVVTLDDYQAHMKPRSPKWKTVNLAKTDFESLWRGFVDTTVASV